MSLYKLHVVYTGQTYLVAILELYRSDTRIFNFLLVVYPLIFQHFLITPHYYLHYHLLKTVFFISYFSLFRGDLTTNTHFPQQNIAAADAAPNSPSEDNMLLQRAYKKIANLKEDIRHLCNELQQKDSLLTNVILGALQKNCLTHHSLPRHNSVRFLQLAATFPLLET